MQGQLGQTMSRVELPIKSRCEQSLLANLRIALVKKTHGMSKVDLPKEKLTLTTPKNIIRLGFFWAAPDLDWCFNLRKRGSPVSDGLALADAQTTVLLPLFPWYHTCALQRRRKNITVWIQILFILLLLFWFFKPGYLAARASAFLKISSYWLT